MMRSPFLLSAAVPLLLCVAACSSSAGGSGATGSEGAGSGAAVLQPSANGGPKGAAPTAGLAPDQYTATAIT
jgi:hypothetical protein